MTKESLKKQENMSDSLFELNTLILDLRSKLTKSLQEVLKLRKDLDLEKEEHQLTQIKYDQLKGHLDTLINSKIDAARNAIEIASDEKGVK